MISQDALTVLTPEEIDGLRTGLPIHVIRKLIKYEKDRISLLHESLGAVDQDDESIVRLVREGFITNKTLDSILHFFEEVNL